MLHFDVWLYILSIIYLCLYIVLSAMLFRLLQHENLVRLYGVCTKVSPILILTEYMRNGNISLSFLFFISEINVYVTSFSIRFALLFVFVTRIQNFLWAVEFRAEPRNLFFSTKF